MAKLTPSQKENIGCFTWALVVIVIVNFLFLKYKVIVDDDPYKVSTYTFNVELVNGNNSDLTLELPEIFEYEILSPSYYKSTYCLEIITYKTGKSIFGNTIKVNEDRLYFNGIVFVNSISKK